MIFINRFNLLKNPKIVGEIIGDIGIGILASAIFAISQGEIDLNIFLDSLGAIIAIIEGSFMKYKELV
jgi:hypothetical protein